MFSAFEAKCIQAFLQAACPTAIAVYTRIVMRLPASKWIIRRPCPCCPGVGNRKSVIKETAIPVVETFIINPLECNHAPFGVNTFKGGHDYDQVSRDSQA